MIHWQIVFKFGAALFAAQLLIGFSHGFFVTSDEDALSSVPEVVSTMASLVLSAAIFARLHTQLSERAYTHSLLAILVQVVLGIILFLALPAWLQSFSLRSAVLETLVLLGGLLIGSRVGVTLHSRRAPRAEA